MYSFLSKRQKNDDVMSKALLITAHPDDEVMFFGPLLLALPKYCELSVLCLSNGNFEGLGKTRIEELHRSLEIFKVPVENVTVIEHPELQDGMNQVWPVSTVESVVYERLKTGEFSVVSSY
jgi:N-acetylglucosaminylphosphatidylinositol deacetylase